MMLWIIFFVTITCMLIIDLYVVGRHKHDMTLKESLFWTAVWISLAMLFNIGIWYSLGATPALNFFAGYALEKALSVDNLFVFLMIFSYFKVTGLQQRKILIYGILGALVMRACFIFMGIALIEKFHWIIYIFGAVLLVSGLKLCTGIEKDIKIEKNFILNITKRFFPKISTFLLVLIIVEATDIVFAIDSVPAVLSITSDPFIVFTSNVFAILGLRALYFLLSGIMPMFKYLHYGLGGVLTFIGTKMLISHWIHIPIGISLGVILTFISGSILISVISEKKKKQA